ncbi:uncharacterized protein LY89DRAFT_115382 [Mollisia scopiformis]|uniref:Uncharacterized protein n=1 Tax=Mollisia scopiformis TaxID=149040 RepID=A0A194X5Q6_MOLSC|nr:uncharacterized protein LY89DRAFT_115382 [Mollisia scopiformis]KUJ15515.1 hypothetical protein LY89DRAFT_115382 [Mollisia scopiformis]
MSKKIAPSFALLPQSIATPLYEAEAEAQEVGLRVRCQKLTDQYFPQCYAVTPSLSSEILNFSLGSRANFSYSKSQKYAMSEAISLSNASRLDVQNQLMSISDEYTPLSGNTHIQPSTLVSLSSYLAPRNPKNLNTFTVSHLRRFRKSSRNLENIWLKFKTMLCIPKKRFLDVSHPF